MLTVDLAIGVDGSDVYETDTKDHKERRIVLDAFTASTAAEEWVDSFDQGSAGVDIVDLVVQDPYGETPVLTLHLKELVSTELGYVLRCDAAARGGEGAVSRDRFEPENGEVLRYAATRLDLLSTNAELASTNLDKGWPSAAADLLAEAARASDALSSRLTRSPE